MSWASPQRWKGEIAKIVAAVEEKAAAALAELQALLEELEAELAEKKAELEQASGELKEQLEAVIAQLEAKIAELKAAIAKLEAMLNELKEGILATLEELYRNATHGEYTITPESHYVALGDGTAAAESYAELLAAELGNLCGGNYSYTNLAQNGLMIEEIYNVLLSNPTEIGKADLVTLGFGNNGFTNFAVENMMALINETPIDLDWSTYVGEEGVPYVEKVLEKLYEELEESGFTGVYMGVNITDLLAVAVESYAYSYVAYSCNLPEACLLYTSPSPRD